MADFDVVVDKLHSLESADEIADLLRSYGIKAYPQEARSCAISKFVEMETGKVGRIITSTECITVNEVIGPLSDYVYDVYEQTTEMISHSPAMHRFVRKFDSGAYPDLIVEGYNYDPY